MISLSQLITGVTIAFLVFEALEHLLPKKLNGQVPWDTTSVDPSAPKQLHTLAGIGKKFTLGQWFLKNKKYRDRLDLLLVRSGHPFQWTVEDLIFFKFLFLVLAGVLMWAYDIQSPLLWIGGLFVGFQFIEIYLKMKGSSRRLDIERRLPAFIDLLTLTIEGGLDLMAAVERILDKMKPSALREELLILSQETRLGTPRKEALGHWVYRTNLPDVQSLTALIIQSEELGTGLATILRSYADDMRVRRITKAEEVAGKAPVKILIPMMVFFLPIVFVIIFGPLAMSVIRTTSGK